MKNTFSFGGVDFEIVNYAHRKNEYEKGLKYRLVVSGMPTSILSSTKHYLKEYAIKNYFIWK